MINHARLTGGLVRKDPVDTVHPLVRIHPVTGEKCLWFNGEFITKIPGLKEPEQRWLLDFLMQHIVSGHDFQARVRWQPKTIVIFDNRSTIRKSFRFCLPPCISFKRGGTGKLTNHSTL
jgi:sulfonate dioxygenase